MFQLPCLITGGYIINLVRVWEPGVFLSPEPQQNYLMGWHEVWLVLSENAVYPTQLRPFHAISINYNPTIRRYWIDLEGLAIIFKRSQLAFISSPCLEAWVLNAIGLCFFSWIIEAGRVVEVESSKKGTVGDVLVVDCDSGMLDFRWWNMEK